MSSSRVVYQNWIADLGRDPAVPIDSFYPNEVGGQPDGRVDELERFTARLPDSQELQRVDRIRAAVTQALSKLSANEREIVEQFHFMGRTYSEIAELSGRAPHRLDALRQRALRKLRKILAPLVKELYGLGSASGVVSEIRRRRGGLLCVVSEPPSG
jgi:RNA polymerase sigma factor (sigma-70 family)